MGNHKLVPERLWRGGEDEAPERIEWAVLASTTLERRLTLRDAGGDPPGRRDGR